LIWDRVLFAVHVITSTIGVMSPFRRELVIEVACQLFGLNADLKRKLKVPNNTFAGKHSV
jgi:hypothetical protein